MQTYGDYDYTEALYIDYDTSADEDNYYFNVIIGLEDFITLPDEDITVTWTCTSKNRMYGSQTITTTIPAGSRYVVYSWDDEQDEDIAYPFVDSLEITECDYTSFYGIKEAYLSYNKESYDDDNTGVYIGTDGIGLGAGTFYVDTKGYLYATNIYIEGKANLEELYVSGAGVFEESLSAATLDVETIDVKNSIVFGDVCSLSLPDGSGDELTAELNLSKGAKRQYTYTVSITDSEGNAYAVRSLKNFPYRIRGYDENGNIFSWTGNAKVLAGNSSQTTTVTTNVDFSISEFYFSQSGTTTYTWTESTDLTITGNLIPSAKGNYSLGTDSNYYNGVYALYLYSNDSSVEYLSDRNKKKEICDLNSLEAINLIKGLNPVKFKYIDDIQNKERYGLIAQDVEQYLLNLGVDIKNQAIVKKISDEKGGETYWLNYTEFITPIIRILQYLLDKMS